jgi:aerobic-type carbon monoxide dehydrogenase small subunit (CoxS/CutS family)
MKESRMGALDLVVNGTRRRVEAPPEESLLSVLRNRLQLTGTKYGCGEGQCGACTVLLDGRAVRSCRTPVSEAAGKKVTTIEGLEKSGRLHPVQAAFLEEEAFQCGYCTPGMIISAAGLLAANGNPSEEEIAGRMNGNICRCGTYPRILAAVKRAAQAMRKA